MDRRRVAYIGVAIAVLIAGLFLRTSRTPAPPLGNGPAVSSADGGERADGAEGTGEGTSATAGPCLREPASAVVELGVLTDRTEATLSEATDRDHIASLLGAELCGEEDACRAVRLALKDEHTTALRIGVTADWTAGRSDFDASAATLSPAERASLAKRGSVVVVRVASARSARQLAIRTAFATASVLATAVDGLVYDPLLGRTENAKVFAKHAVTEPLEASAFRSDRIDVLYEPRGEGVVRLVTAGLERFGAPDVEVANAPLVAGDRAAQLLVAVAAAVADGARAATLTLTSADLARASAAVRSHLANEVDSGPGSVEVRLLSVHPETGDASDFIARIEPGGGEGPAATLELLESAFGQVLGVEPDEASIASQHDRAQHALGSALARWQETRKAGGRLLVRLPFAIPGGAGSESMWVEVSGYGAETVTGVLVDEPLAATDVSRGDRVTRPRSQVEDVRERRSP